MGKLMGSHKVGLVYVLLRVEDAADKAKLRVGNGVGERLREEAITRELEDAELTILEGAEIFLVVCQAGWGGGNHVVLVKMPAVAVPVPLGISGRQGNLIVGSTDNRVEGYPVGFRAEEISH